MNRERLAREIGAMRIRLGAFREHATRQAAGGVDLLPQALEELGSAMEELRVSEEQVRVQADEIASARQLLEDERRRYQELFEQAPAPYLVTDRLGVIKEANRRACRMLRVEREFLGGRPFTAFIPLHDRFSFRTLLRWLDDSGPHGDVQLRLEPHGGPPLLATFVVSVVRDQRRHAARICWLARGVAASDGEPPDGPGPADEEMLRATLEELGEAAASVFHAGGAGVMLLDDFGELRWLQSSDRLTQRFEQAQIRFHEGPCIDAFEEDRAVWTEDLRFDNRWPRLGALDHGGIRAILCAPIEAADGPIGTCNIVSLEPRTWSQADIGAVRAYARALGTLLRVAAEAHASSVLAAQLQYALDQRVVIEQAKGVLMERNGLDSQAAFERLRSMARSSGRKLVDVAAEVVVGTR